MSSARSKPDRLLDLIEGDGAHATSESRVTSDAGWTYRPASGAPVRLGETYSAAKATAANLRRRKGRR